MESDTKTTIISLTPKNYHKWIKEIQGLAVRANVWEYVDPQGTKQEPTNGECPDVSDYAVPLQSTITVRPDQDSAPRIRPARDFNELSAAQKESLKINIATWELKERRINKIAKGMQIVDNAIKISARSYIPSDEMTSSCRDIIRMLAARYKLTKDQIIEQIQDEFQDLKWAPTKEKVEEWVIRWENLRGHIVRAGIMGLFGSDATYTKEFLKAGRKWAPDFCDSWVREHRAAGREVDFFHTTREYRNEVEMTLKNARNGGHNQANATLQGKTPDQADQSGHNHHGSGHCPGHGDEKFKGRKCVCGEVHLFKECPYIVTSARKSGWTENSTVREEIRQKIMKNPRFLTAIKHITDTNILDGLDQKDQTAETAETDDYHFHFSGVATATKNSLSNSVIYDSGCSQPLTYDKARFVGEITPASDWIDTPNGPMLAEGYGTMRVNGKLGDKAIRMDFAKTAWVPTTNMTLVSVNKLKKEGYIWDMNQNVLIQQKDGKKVCNIEEHYGLPTIEFNLVPIKKMVAIKQEDDGPIQKDDNPVTKTSHTGQIVASGGGDEVPVQAKFEKDDSVPVDFEDKISSHASVDSVDSVDTNSDWCKGAPNDLIWMDQLMDQKAHLMDTANGAKKRRFRCKKRCKKRRSKNSKNWAQCGEKVGFQD
jgi:hypothetical protein